MGSCSMGRPVFDGVRPSFSLQTMALSTLQVALTDGFGEAVVARDMHDLNTEKEFRE